MIPAVEPQPSYPIARAKPTVTEPPVESQQRSAPRPKPTLAQRIVAFTFLGAFGLTMLTVVLTGLWVRSPSARRAPETIAVTLALDEPRSVNLVFDSQAAVEAVELTVDLPPGIELVDRPGERRVVWHTMLAAGSNALPLTLVARGGRGGELAARLRHGDEQMIFAVVLNVTER
jgi:hypothetical protein